LQENIPLNNLEDIHMKNYTITVNGTPYNVSVEEGTSSAPAAAPAAPAPAPAAAPAPKAEAAPAPAPAAPAAARSVSVGSPMPGNTLFVLEAMKMENEIVAPQDGTVASVNVNKGDTVEAGQTLVSMN